MRIISTSCKKILYILKKYYKKYIIYIKEVKVYDNLHRHFLSDFLDAVNGRNCRNRCNLRLGRNKLYANSTAKFGRITLSRTKILFYIT